MTIRMTDAYILKAKKFAEPPFQSKKNCGKSAGHFWAILDHSWAILGYIWATLGHFGSFLAIFGPVCGILGQICGKFYFFAASLGSGNSLLECMSAGCSSYQA